MPRIRTRRRLLVVALLLQAVVLGAGWWITFVNVRSAFARSIEDTVVRGNAELADRVAALLPEIDPGTVEFGGMEWERLQRVVEGLDDLPADGFACILDPEGRILCHPDIRRDPGLRGVDLDDHVVDLPAAGPAGARSRLRLADAPPGTVSGTVDFAPGNTHFVATRALAGGELRLLVHQPVSELVTVGRRTTGFVLAAAACAATLVLLLTGLGLWTVVRAYDSVVEGLNRKLKGDLAIAREIQQATMPLRTPRLAGLELAAWSEPAEETGGDTFDAIGLREDGTITPEGGEAAQAVLMLGDATGHGVGPALAATSVRSMLRMGARAGLDPVALARHLNEQLAHDLPPGRFVTAAILVADARDASVSWISAGQGPLLHVRADGTVRRIGPDAAPLGVLPELELDAPGANRLVLAPGDAFIVVSDGIHEATIEDGTRLGLDRLDALARELAGRAGATATSIAEALRSVGAVAPEDDRTVLVVRRPA